MAERVQVPELRQVVVALAQAEKLGVPVAKTLQVQAAELRLKRRQHAEEQAMKLPVKILFPMVLCILPCLFIVVLGPGGDQHLTNLERLTRCPTTVIRPRARPRRDPVRRSPRWPSCTRRPMPSARRP